MIVTVATGPMGYIQSATYYHFSPVQMKSPLSRVVKLDLCIRTFQKGVSFRMTLRQKVFALVLLMAAIRTRGIATVSSSVKTAGRMRRNALMKHKFTILSRIIVKIVLIPAMNVSNTVSILKLIFC